MLGEVDRGREPGAALDGSGVRAAQEDRNDSVPRSPRSRRSGFGVFALGSLQVLYLNDTLHVTNILHRGFVLSIAGWAAVPFLYPGRSLLRPHVSQGPGDARSCSSALLILPSALFTPLQVSTQQRRDGSSSGASRRRCSRRAPSRWSRPCCKRCARTGCAGSASRWASCTSCSSAASPARSSPTSSPTRSASAATVILLGVPTSLIGSLLLMNGARFIRHDLSLVVEELLEEQEEHRKRHGRRASTHRSCKS